MTRPKPNSLCPTDFSFEPRRAKERKKTCNPKEGPRRAYPGVCSIKFFFWSARPPRRVATTSHSANHGLPDEDVQEVQERQRFSAREQSAERSARPSSFDLRASPTLLFTRVKRIPGFNYNRCQYCYVYALCPLCIRIVICILTDP